MAIYVNDSNGNKRLIAGRTTGNVQSFNGRTGAVLPKTGDYSIDMVGGSNHNLLDNWYFADPINQRGQTSYSGKYKTYGIDRWFGTSTDLTVTVDSGSLLIQSKSQSDFTAHFCQNSELYGDLKGRTVTLSLLIEALDNDTIIRFGFRAFGTVYPFITDVPLALGKQVVTDTYDVSGEYVLEHLFITVNAGKSYRLHSAKLELGPVQTLAHKEGDTWVLNDPPPNKALELAKCQRYLYPLPPYGYLNGFVNAASTTIHIPIRWINMKSNPTIINKEVYLNNLTIDCNGIRKTLIYGTHIEDASYTTGGTFSIYVSNSDGTFNNMASHACAVFRSANVKAFLSCEL